MNLRALIVAGGIVLVGLSAVASHFAHLPGLRTRLSPSSRSFSRRLRPHSGYLDAIRGEPVAEPAAYLRCRIAVAGHAADAPDCHARFRERFPASAHADDALAAEAAGRAEAGDCARARPLLEAALQRHLSAAISEALRAHLLRCAH